jgi:hypothetical protein
MHMRLFLVHPGKWTLASKIQIVARSSCILICNTKVFSFLYWKPWLWTQVTAWCSHLVLTNSIAVCHVMGGVPMSEWVCTLVCVRVCNLLSDLPCMLIYSVYLILPFVMTVFHVCCHLSLCNNAWWQLIIKMQN